MLLQHLISIRPSSHKSTWAFITHTLNKPYRLLTEYELSSLTYPWVFITHNTRSNSLMLLGSFIVLMPVSLNGSKAFINSPTCSLTCLS
ncbi:hypothetical protein AMTR_s00015p00212450 [Amborella trichopoda]|uniref:Uncharacterized protein n=1 Tax=Amborella trichopoda TaxID=13333 RepID=W1PLH0_AMBTC|nr:hypothetical protein AMTR_s00015p00212450 [Amborella trichopoda]